MKVVCPYSNKGLDERLAEAFAAGVRAHGDQAIALPAIDTDDVEPGDVIVLFGVKQRARYQRYRAEGRQLIVLDKGYVRRRAPGPHKEVEYWRVAVNAHHPTDYLESIGASSDRWDALGVQLASWKRGSHVVFAGSSDKYHRFNDLPHPTLYAAKVVSEIRRHTAREIIYRPKPSWAAAEPVAGAQFSRWPERIEDVLSGAHVLVTNGSNSCFEAVISGIPCIVLGDAVAKPISSLTIADVERPRRVTPAERLQWLSNLAYCQWTMGELASGEAWPHIRRHLR